MDASNVTEHGGFDKDEVIFRLEGQGPIRLDAVPLQPGHGVTRIGPADKPPTLNIGREPLNCLQGNGYLWENDKTYGRSLAIPSEMAGPGMTGMDCSAHPFPVPMVQLTDKGDMEVLTDKVKCLLCFH